MQDDRASTARLSDGLYRVEARDFVAGFVIERGHVTRCAPRLRAGLKYYIQHARKVMTIPIGTSMRYVAGTLDTNQFVPVLKNYAIEDRTIQGSDDNPDDETHFPHARPYDK